MASMSHHYFKAYPWVPKQVVIAKPSFNHFLSIMGTAMLSILVAAVIMLLDSASPCIPWQANIMSTLSNHSPSYMSTAWWFT